jgi:glycerate 2-kinase
VTPDDSRAAVDCALAGIRAVDPYTLVVEALQSTHHPGHLSVISIGKAAAAMARGAWSAVGNQISRGIIVAPTPVDPPSTHWSVYQGGHPIPTEAGVLGAHAVLDLVTSLTADDTLLCLISGGASALMTFPADGIALADAQTLTTTLLRAGATIAELNCVRKHIDRLKGGRLARLASPARVIALILSDVVGDPVDVIASGPTVPDPTTVADAIRILHDRNIWQQTPPAIRQYLESATDESPKPGDPCFASVTSTIIGNNTKAAEAARAHAESLGYHAAIVTTTLTGESRDVGAAIIHHARALQATLSPPSRHALIYAGETTVTVTGSGRGGRNQELTLAAAIALDGNRGITLTSIGTDGIDGPTDAAGAVANGHTLSRARTLGLDAHHALADNDAYPFWQALGDLIITGPTGTNVMDLVVMTIE